MVEDHQDRSGRGFQVPRSRGWVWRKAGGCECQRADTLQTQGKGQTNGEQVQSKEWQMEEKEVYGRTVPVKRKNEVKK